MAIDYDAPVSPVDLTQFIRRVPMGPGLKLLPLFPEKLFGTNKVDVSEIVVTNLVAKYRAFDGRISVADRDSGSLKQLELIPLSGSRNEGEYERLQMQFARTGGTFREGLAQVVYNDGEALTRYVQNRLEMAWGDVLVDGKISINENGVIAEYDFGVPENQLVTAGTLWSDTANAKALSDLISWAQTYRNNNGAAPGAIRATQAVISVLQQNKEIVDAVHGSQTGRSRVNRDDLNGLLVSEGLPYIQEQEVFVASDGGDNTPALPSDRIWFTPENIADLGVTAYGVSATALELVESKQVDFSFSAAPGLVGVVEKVGPPYRKFTYIDGVALPILTDARKLAVAKVL